MSELENQLQKSGRRGVALQTIAADKITLYDLGQRFQLRQAVDPAFFSEWQGDLPPLTEAEQQRLERVRAIVANLEQRSVLENTMKLAVVSPHIGFVRAIFTPVLRQHRRLNRN